MNSRLQNSLTLGVYSCSHCAVDAACAALGFGMAHVYPLSSSQFITLIIAYNLLAFGTQPLFGWIADFLAAYRLTALLGIGLTALSLIAIKISPVLAVATAGVGNSLFHVAGGAVSLAIAPHRATAPGIFVAPGALGIFIGAMVGRAGPVPAWPFLIILVVLFLTTIFLKYPETANDETPHYSPIPLPALFGTLLLFSIAVRSFAGFATGAPYQAHQAAIILLTLSAVVGKATGGIVSDRFGWLAVSVSALVLSVPLLGFCRVSLVLAVAGMLLLQMTMPVTLTALRELFPRFPAFSFGLASGAFIIGALLLFSGLKPLYGSWPLLMVLVSLSAVALFIALKLLPGKR
jgi:FSR family fosmidomycin resistance protein-like MFS transporter